MGLLDTLKQAISGTQPEDEESQPFEDTKVSNLGSDKLAVYEQRAQKINALEDSIEKLDDDQLSARIAQIRNQLQDGSVKLDDCLNEVFAIVREASFRVLGLRHYDVQLVGGMVLNDGCIAEMATGEGKTIVAALPSCLNALTGQSVHVVTVNDYLAKRDAELVGQVHRFLGLSVGLIQAGMSPADRRAAYSCDITYVTNSELGFDYLRDNLAMVPDDVVLVKPLGFCIVDEADSILIDEARTPLIISGEAPAPSNKYAVAQKAANALSKGVHYTVNEKEQTVLLTEKGYSDLENALKVDDLFDTREPWAPFILNSLKAKEVFKKDVNYIVAFDEENQKQEIQIIDEFTGRAMKGRRWSDGLHQAVEAKESLPVEKEATTTAKISYQAFFKLFEKLSGMTGTAATEASELGEIYALSVVTVPTAFPKARKDYPDVVFKNGKGKLLGVMREIARVAPTGRPILIGTTSVESSEALSQLLKDVDVFHDVLNAKPESALRESEIIAQAGRKFSITIATNMAGRGTDILLGGNGDYFARAIARRVLTAQNSNLYESMLQAEQSILLEDESLPADISEETLQKIRESAKRIASSANEMKMSTLLGIDELVSIAAEYGPIPDGVEGIEDMREAMSLIRSELQETIDEEREEVLELGGLYVIGTERSESRRVDNQLRGRSGRQGDPGSSRFFLSLDDRLFRLFGGDKVSGILETFRVDDDTPIENPLVNRTLNSSQENVETYFRDIRKQLFTYDDVLAQQRSGFYAQRRKLLLGGGETVMERVTSDCKETVAEILPNFIGRKDQEDDYERLSGKVLQFFDGIQNVDQVQLANCQGVEDYVNGRVEALVLEKSAKLEQAKPGFSANVARFILLTQMDNLWQEHMKRMDFLKEFIILRAYGDEDPLTVYQTEGFELFQEMTQATRRNSVYSFFQYKLST